jgi:hypothetical protein
MATTPVSASDPIQTLARTILQRFDQNGDGQLNADEFWSVLKQIAQQLNAGTGQSAATSTTAAVGTAAITAPLAAVNPRVRLEGFNLAREQNPQKSAKDAFAMLAQRSGYLPRTKPECEAWFNTYIRQGMEDLGYQIHWVQGDKFRVTAREGVYDIDFVRGAGGDDPALQWLAEAAA